MDIRGKVALVTGGGTGIGRATSLALARRGAAVAVNFSRSQADAEATVTAITDAGGTAMAVRADVAREADVLEMVADVADRLGGIDVLVNNAGTTRYIPMTDLDAITDDDWDTIMAVNLKGAFYCARAVAPQMRARGGGAICNVSSLAAFTGDGSSLPYSVSKAALAGLTRSLARALAPSIRVTAVAPGIVETRWVTGKEDHVRRLSEGALLKRNATAEDVAAMACALLEQEAVTGQIVIVDGGLRV